MSNRATVYIRCEQTEKEALERAAADYGTDLNTFVVDAALAAAKAVKRPRRPDLTVKRGVPVFFGNACRLASTGGAVGYFQATEKLAAHLTALVKNKKRLTDLRALVKLDDTSGVLDWFETEMPACLALVPRRHWRDAFMGGIRSAYADGRL